LRLDLNGYPELSARSGSDYEISTLRSASSADDLTNRADGIHDGSSSRVGHKSGKRLQLAGSIRALREGDDIRLARHQAGHGSL
jgi:hypothetical protein